MQLVVFHYHLLPGGVTDVIENSLKAVVHRVGEITAVRLVCGGEDNARGVLSRLQTSGIPATLDILPELGYTSPAERMDEAHERARFLEGHLLNRYGSEGSLWWVHNHHVGKNPAFTLALCTIAETHPEIRMLLHIHDFPECARYENLAYLNRVAGNSPYPEGSSVQYAVINSRDRDALVAAGLRESSVHLMVNPVTASGSGRASHGSRGSGSAVERAVSRKRVNAGLAAFAEKKGQHFVPDRPVLLYPVRTIRRKNVLEMALVARLASDMNIVATLPGTSDAEKPYSDLVHEAFRSGAAHGVFGIGRNEEKYGLSFEMLTHNSDAIVSSSIQEGFGLLFVDALRWSVPLYARDLPVLDGIRSVFAGYPAAFYDRLLVPFSTPGLSSVRAYLGMRYRERLDKLKDILSEPVRQKLESELEQLLGDELIDFSYLPPELQLPYLTNLDDRGFASELRSTNRSVINGLEAIVSAQCPDSEDVVQKTFGYDTYARAFKKALGSFGEEPSAGGAASSADVQSRLVDRFAELENLRLLFAPVGHTHEDGET